MDRVKTDEGLTELLAEAKTVAVVGIKVNEAEDAYRVPLYLQDAGYRIFPVNPKLDAALNEKCHKTLTEVSEPVDIVNIFRASENVPAHVDEILSLETPPKSVWMQLGIHHGESARRLREAGIEVIQDRCIMVDHRRLLGASG